jgi:hypothetical protein
LKKLLLEKLLLEKQRAVALAVAVVLPLSKKLLLKKQLIPVLALDLAMLLRLLKQVPTPMEMLAQVKAAESDQTQLPPLSQQDL